MTFDRKPLKIGLLPFTLEQTHGPKDTQHYNKDPNNDTNVKLQNNIELNIQKY
jgi:hypothetical protein